MKRIVICLDGTWNKPDQQDRGKRKPTNVVKMARAVTPLAKDGAAQVCYYNDGVGTNWGLDKIAGGGFGIGLSANIVDAYDFLVLNYEPGDEIFLFGFSRGAYSARSLAGVIDAVGVLPKSNAFFVPDAYMLYRNRAEPEAIQAFRGEHNTHAARIKFVGVWDTVGALGIPVSLFKSFNKRYEFHKVELNQAIDNAYQALAIDEQRRPFQPTLWALPQGSSQKLEQVWFAGVHSNIGGGYAKDGLANITLHWMKDKAIENDLAIEEEFLKPYRPWFGDEMRDSMNLGYRILIPVQRKIGHMSRGNESVHPSVYQRIEHDPGYAPENVPPATHRT